jgi:hypothetical protein
MYPDIARMPAWIGLPFLRLVCERGKQNESSGLDGGWSDPSLENLLSNPNANRLLQQEVMRVQAPFQERPRNQAPFT